MDNTRIPIVHSLAPFAQPVVEGSVPAGLTIADALLLSPINRLQSNTLVYLDDELIPLYCLDLITIQEGQTIVVKEIPMGGGGGGGGKNVLRVVVMVAVIAVAAWAAVSYGAALSTWATGLGYGTMSVGLGQSIVFATVTMVGQLAMGALIPPAVPKLSSPAAFSSDPDREPLVPMITGSANRRNPYGVIPKIYGTHKLYPIKVQEYTEVAGDSGYFRALFIVGHGRLKISDIKLGEEPLSNFDDLDYEVREGTPSDTAITLYTRNVSEERLNLLLKYNVGQVRTSATDAEELSVDITFPQGLAFYTNEGKRTTRTVTISVEYRLVGAGSWTTQGTFTVTDATRTAVRRSMRWTVTNGQYEIRVTRTHTEDSSPQVVDAVYWSALRAFHAEDLITESNIATIALRIRFSNQLSGRISQLNCLAQSYLSTYNGSTWVADQLTQNPAWAYADVLTGSGNSRAMATSRLDASAIKAWADRNDTAGRTFNYIFDRGTTVFEAMTTTASAGRATPDMKDGIYTVVEDEPQSTPVQLITPRNSWGYEGTRAFSDIPHAIKAQFLNEDEGYVQDEAIIYRDGYTAANATKYETMSLAGVTTYAHAWKLVRYYMATALSRPELHTLSTDFEHLVATRGDLIHLQHDVPLLSLNAARVASVTTSGTDVTAISLDTTITMEVGKNYGVEIRSQSGTAVSVNAHAIDWANGDQTSVTFSTSIPNSSTQPSVGDLVTFGEAGSETVPMLVKAIEPFGEDLHAKLTLVNYDAAVYTADTSTLPTFNSKISRTARFSRPPKPVVASVRSDETALVRLSNGQVDSRILLTFDPLSSTAVAGELMYRTRVRPSGSTAWQSSTTTLADVGEQSVGEVEDGVTYEVQIQTVRDDGATSEFTTLTHTVIGQSAKPAVPTNVVVENLVVRWTYTNPPIDLDGFKIRYHQGTNTSWETALAAHAGVVADTVYPIHGLAKKGAVTILVKAVDLAGNESTDAASCVATLGERVNTFGDPLSANVVETYDYAANGYPLGTRTNALVSGTTLTADDDGAVMYSTTNTNTLMYGPDDTAAFYSLNYHATYEFEYLPPRSALPADLRIESTVVGDYSVEYKTGGTQSPFYGSTNNLAAMYATNSSTLMYSGGSPTYTPFPTYLANANHNIYYFKMALLPSSTQGSITALKAILDVPDMHEIVQNFTPSASGSRVTLTKPFRTITAMQYTHESANNTAVSAHLLDKDVTLGPLLQLKNTSGTGVSEPVTVTIQGY